MKTRRIEPGRALILLQKARRYREAARLALGRGQWDPAASSAVHCAINAIDAVCARRLARKAADHHDSPALLASIESIPAADKQATGNRLRELLGMKTLAEYEDRLLGSAEAAHAVTLAERVLSKAEAWCREEVP